nr:polymorphic toxin type 28 domain-containing protein [uncultured Actinoplanes sp.]
MTDLGGTHDPRALVPGDPVAVRANAAALDARGAHAEKAGDGLAGIDAGGWEGPASEEFREKFGYEPNRWYEASNSLATAAAALKTYAHTLEWAQQQAAEAIRLWDQAEAESRQARLSGSTAPALADPGDAGRQAARDTLSRAREQVDSAAGVAARFLTQEADAAPENPSWLDKAADFATDLGADVINGVASFGNAMVQHPGETAALAGGIALTAISATGDGVGLALDATGVGAVAGVPLNVVSTAGVVAGATITGAATTSLMQHAAGEDAVTPVRGSEPARSVPRKTDRLKEHLTDKDLDAARREMNGEVVRTKSTGQPWDHVDEVRNAQRGLVKRIDQLKRLLGDSRVSDAERATYQDELSEASRLLDHSEQYLPRS